MKNYEGKQALPDSSLNSVQLRQLGTGAWTDKWNCAMGQKCKKQTQAHMEILYITVADELYNKQ